MNTVQPLPRPATSGGLAFITLLEAFRATGGTVPGDIVARLLQDHPVGNAVSLANLIATGEVFGFGWRGALWIPMFQFDGDDLSLKPRPRQVRAELPASWSGWTLASWFAAPNENLSGQRPVDLLDSNLTAALDSARSSRAPDEWVHPRTPRVRQVAAHV